MKRNNVLFYIVFISLFSIYSFVFQPFIKTKYIANDIKNFEDNYSWKIYLFLWFLFVVFGFYKVKKTKEKIGELGMTSLLFLVLGYIFFNHFITNNTLFINQLISKEKENIIYETINQDGYISLMEKGNNENIFEEENLDKINKIRKQNHLESLNQVKNGDTIKIVFDKGLFGFKYLK